MSVAQAWGCACSGWTVWVFAGSCVGLASDFSANDCVTSIYIQMCFCKFRSRISIEVINESQMFYAQHFCLCFPPFVGLFCLSRFCQKRGNVLVKTWYYFICGGLAWAVKLSEQGWRSGTSLCTCLRLDLLESALWDILECECVFLSHACFDLPRESEKTIHRHKAPEVSRTVLLHVWQAAIKETIRNLVINQVQSGPLQSKQNCIYIRVNLY